MHYLIGIFLCFLIGFATYTVALGQERLMVNQFNQVVLVLSEGWESKTAFARFYENTAKSEPVFFWGEFRTQSELMRFCRSVNQDFPEVNGESPALCLKNVNDLLRYPGIYERLCNKIDNCSRIGWYRDSISVIMEEQKARKDDTVAEERVSYSMLWFNRLLFEEAYWQEAPKVGSIKQWIEFMPPTKVTIGKRGLALDSNWLSFFKARGPIKKEGDKKAPAGLFPLQTVFGYSSQPPHNAVDYQQMTDYHLCVDDIYSHSYNHIIDVRRVKKDWISAEKMKRKDSLYSLGIVVGYNIEQIPKKGSCIFMHVWRSSNSSTIGCTAFDPNVMKTLIDHMSRDKKILLIQLPISLYSLWAHTLNFPLIREEAW